jgi:hypothetical protein
MAGVFAGKFWVLLVMLESESGIVFGFKRGQNSN